MNGQLHIGKLKYDNPELMSLDQATGWMKDLLDELNEPITTGSVLFSQSPPFIKFKGEAIKKQNPKYGDIVFFTGELNSRFIANCAKSGEPMLDEIDLEVAAVFISEDSRDKNTLNDEVDLFVDGADYDLYFYTLQKIDFCSVLREYIFLNKNPYPIQKEGNS